MVDARLMQTLERRLSGVDKGRRVDVFQMGRHITPIGPY